MEKIERPKNCKPGDKSILIVDENRLLVRSIIGLLSYEFGDVFNSQTLEDAVQGLNDPKKTFDIVIADINLPDAEYIAVLEGLKETEYKGPLYIVSMNPYKDHEFELRARSYGAKVFFGGISNEIDNIKKELVSFLKANKPKSI